MDQDRQSVKIMGLLGFAAKSRNLVTGYNTCLKLIPSGKLKLLIISHDVGDNTRNKMIQKCESYGVDYREFGKSEELSHATGKEDKGLFGITDKGFANSILKEIDRINMINKHDIKQNTQEEKLSEREVF